MKNEIDQFNANENTEIIRLKNKENEIQVRRQTRAHPWLVEFKV